MNTVSFIRTVITSVNPVMLVSRSDKLSLVGLNAVKMLFCSTSFFKDLN